MLVYQFPDSIQEIIGRILNGFYNINVFAMEFLCLVTNALKTSKNLTLHTAAHLKVVMISLNY